MEILSSPNNEKVKNVAKLLKSAKERKYDGLYVVEGRRMVQEIPEDQLEAVYFTEDFYNKHVYGNEKLKAVTDAATRKDKSYIVSSNVMKKMANTETPQGIMATVKIVEHDLKDLLGNGNEVPLILILERLQDPGNVGTIIRSAEGAGVTGILVSYDSVDIYSPKVVRSTMGSIFRKNVMVTYDLIGDVNKLREMGVVIYATHLNGSSMYDADLTGPVAFLIGNEGAGLSNEISRTARKLIRIPMKGEVESLNAAVSATLVSYEALRQRNKIVI